MTGKFKMLPHKSDALLQENPKYTLSVSDLIEIGTCIASCNLTVEEATNYILKNAAQCSEPSQS